MSKNATVTEAETAISTITTRRNGKSLVTNKEETSTRHKKKRGRKPGSKVVNGKVILKEDLHKVVVNPKEGNIDKIMSSLFEGGITIGSVNKRLSRVVNLRFLQETNVRKKIKMLLLLGMDNEEILTKILTTKY